VGVPACVPGAIGTFFVCEGGESDVVSGGLDPGLVRKVSFFTKFLLECVSVQDLGGFLPGGGRVDFSEGKGAGITVNGSESGISKKGEGGVYVVCGKVKMELMETQGDRDTGYDIDLTSGISVTFGGLLGGGVVVILVSLSFENRGENSFRSRGEAGEERL
jgi:hypothetical protein